jgi:hypothetical protein
LSNEQLIAIIGAGAALLGSIIGGLLTGSFEYFRQKLTKPKLTLDYIGGSANKIESSFEIDGQRVTELFIRARLRNTGVRVARDCRVYLVGVREVDHTSTHETSFHDSMVLAWPGWPVNYDSCVIPRGIDVYVNVISVSKNASGWRFHVKSLFASLGPAQIIAQYWTLSLKVIGWEFYLTATILITVVFMGGIAVVSALLRKSVANVFLSYHHSNYAQVLVLATKIQKSGFNALFVEFTTTPQHDALLDEIYDKIGISDFFICLPGLEPSFVESEVSAAVARKKPIFIILSQVNRGAPNTLQKSYPTLVLEKLELQEFSSILLFLKYLGIGVIRSSCCVAL